MISQMTLRQIPAAVKKGLLLKARKDGRSINRTAVELLQQALGVGNGQGKKRDLSEFAGKWSEEERRAFEHNVKPFERIDAEVWSK
jgi:plasmid stability protein